MHGAYSNARNESTQTPNGNVQNKHLGKTEQIVTSQHVMSNENLDVTKSKSNAQSDIVVKKHLGAHDMRAQFCRYTVKM